MANQQMPTAPPPQPVGENAKKYAWPVPPAKTELLSTSVRRLDGPAKAAGTAKYTFDIARPGMLYARTVRSPHAHAKVVAIDTSAAQSAPGVKAVVIWKDPGGEVMYQGDVVLALAADTEDHARDAARLVKVTYETLPHFSREEKSMASGATKVFAAGNTKEGQTQETGNLETGFKAAAHVVEATYATQVITHVCLESHGAVCEWSGDKVTAWVSTQGVHATRQQLAAALKIPETNVRVICEYMGGGFGSKVAADAPIVLAARLAKDAGRPVKLMLDRKEEHLDSGNRPSAFSQIKAGVAADGKLTAFDAKTWGTGGAGQGANFPLPYIYQFPNRRRSHVDVFINAGNQRPMRAPGHPQGCFATEVLMDELADLVKMDPLEFRLKNLKDPRDLAVVKAAAEKAGWQPRTDARKQMRGDVALGQGISFAQRSGSRCAIVAEVEVNRVTGKVWGRKFTVGHECGIIINPKLLTQTIEGNIVQGTSRSLWEEATFSQDTITSIDWLTYPILDMTEAPETIDVVLIDRKDLPPNGAGECSMRPIAAAIANAIYDATGIRLRQAPFTPDRVKAGFV